MPVEYEIRGRFQLTGNSALGPVVNTAPFNFTVGSVHYAMAAGTPLIYTDSNGNLLMGKNLLGDATQATLQKQVFDFAWLQKHMRLAVRNMTLTEISDPCDINLRRAGEGYPWAQPGAAEGTNENLTGVGAGSLVGQIRGTAFATKLLKKGTATFTLASNQVTIVGASTTWVGLNIYAVPLPGGVVGASPGLSTPGTAVINSVVGDVLTLSANANSSGVAEYAIGGNQTTPGASAVESGAVLNFRTEEMPRDLSGAQDFGVGMGMRWSHARNGTQANTPAMQLSNDGHLLVGQGTVDGGDSGDILQVRGYVGENEVQTITGTPTAGTFTLDCPMVNVPPDGYIPFVTTAPIAFNASAAAVQTALEAVYGAGNVAVTGGPIGTATVTITFTGALAKRNIPTRLQRNTAGLTGGVTVGLSVNGAPTDAGRRLMFLRRGNGITPTADYITVQNGGGQNIFRLKADQSMALISDGANETFAAGLFGPSSEPAIRIGGSTVLYRPAPDQVQMAAGDSFRAANGNIVLHANGFVSLEQATGNGFMQMIEQSVGPGAPPANSARVYLLDNGAGKTQLLVQFATGAAIVLATQP